MTKARGVPAGHKTSPVTQGTAARCSSSTASCSLLTERNRDTPIPCQCSCVAVQFTKPLPKLLCNGASCLRTSAARLAAAGQTAALGTQTVQTLVIATRKCHGLLHSLCQVCHYESEIRLHICNKLNLFIEVLLACISVTLFAQSASMNKTHTHQVSRKPESYHVHVLLHLPPRSYPPGPPLLLWSWELVISITPVLSLYITKSILQGLKSICSSSWRT